MTKNKTLCALFLLLTYASSLFSFSITGSESYVKEVKGLGSFRKLYVSAGALDVYLTQGKKSEVRLEGDEEVVNQLQVQVAQGELEILYSKKKKRNKSGTVKVYITTPYLTNITARGFVNISSEKDWKLSSLNLLITGAGSVEMGLNVKSLSVQLSGSSELTLTGNAQTQDIAVTGSGQYDAGSLKSTKATIILSGAGKATVFAKELLVVTIYGSGDVEYNGSPTIQSNIFGSGRIIKKGIL